MPRLTIRQLDRDNLDCAWPLVRTRPQFSSPSGWRRFANNLFERGGGIIAVSAEDGCVHGIATYEPVTKRDSGRILKVEILVAFELSRRAPVRQALCDALVGFARLFDCTTVDLLMPDGSMVELASEPSTAASRKATPG